MATDTRGLREEHIGKRLRIQLPHGRVEEVDLLELTICQEPEPCCGITYRLLAANHPDESKKDGSVYWVGFGDIEKFQVLGERLA
jgi:hypothetical protein